MHSRREWLRWAVSSAAAPLLRAQSADALPQGPFPVEQDDGWRTLAVTTPSRSPLRNPGLGLVGYTWEEGGPALAVRQGKQPLEQAIEELASLPFVDVLYIRCDWRHVQSRPGRLDLHPVWKLTLDAARRHGQRVAFRVQLSNPEPQPKELALPAFLQEKVPLVSIGRLSDRANFQMREPRYDHPAFLSAFDELNELLAAEFDGHELVEFVDLMQYGFWGEGHTSDLPNPFPDYATARSTMLRMGQKQWERWRKTPLAVNTQPDISKVGNDELVAMAVRAGCWLRSDSILVEEPIQIDQLANRPPHLAIVMEDGYYRQYDPELKRVPKDGAGVNDLDKSLLHALDLGANYWSLWTESGNLSKYVERYPRAIASLRERIGYRVRPSWVWQRKRQGCSEVIVCVANDGVAGVPGTLRLTLESPDGSLRLQGALDAGHPHGGRIRQASFVLPKGVEPRRMQLRAELEIRPGVRRPVRWACEQPLESSGAFAIELKGFNEPGWRKGV